MEEEIKAKLANLDADTLRQLLHSMIASKSEDVTPSDQEEISYDPNLNEASETDHNKNESSEVVEETSSNHDSPHVEANKNEEKNEKSSLNDSNLMSSENLSTNFQNHQLKEDEAVPHENSQTTPQPSYSSPITKDTHMNDASLDDHQNPEILTQFPSPTEPTDRENNKSFAQDIGDNGEEHNDLNSYTKHEQGAVSSNLLPVKEITDTKQANTQESGLGDVLVNNNDDTGNIENSCEPTTHPSYETSKVNEKTLEPEDEIILNNTTPVSFQASNTEEVKDEKTAISMLSNNPTETFLSSPYPSEIPPVIIPLFSLRDYLPEDMTMPTLDNSIVTLALRPKIILKDGFAVMVFEKFCYDKHETASSDLSSLKAPNCDLKNVQLLSKQAVKYDTEKDSYDKREEVGGISSMEQDGEVKEDDDYKIFENELKSKGETQELDGYSGVNKPAQQMHEQQVCTSQQLQPQQLQPNHTQPQQYLQQPQQYLQQPQQLHSQQQLQLEEENGSQLALGTSQLALGTSQLAVGTSQQYTLEQQPIPRSSSLPQQLPSTSISNQDTSPEPINFLPGVRPPVWIKDETVTSCAYCGKLFSITRRKHHCRACGKIFCSVCCDQLAQLPYLGKEIARICVNCTRLIKKARAQRVRLQNEAKSGQSSIKPIKQQQTTMSTGLVYLPRERFNPPSRNYSQERNYFMPQTLSTSPENNFNPDVSSSLQQVDNSSLMNDETMSNIDSIQETADSTAQHFYNASNAWKVPTRPVGLTVTWTSRESSVMTEDQRKRFKSLSKALKNPEGAIVQVADRITVSTKVIRVTIKQELHDAWFMFSKGFENFGQNEIAFFLEKRIAEDVFPYEMLKIFRTLYSLSSKQGQRFRHCNYLAFSNSLLGSEENVGFLFISAKKLPNVVRHYINGNTAIVGILLKYTELACARYIPARLLNALGAQQQTFPSPAISSRDRPSVVNLPSNEIFYSTFVAFNQFLNNKIPQVLIPEVHILKSNSRVILELPFLYQTEVLSMLDALLVKDDEPVTIPIAGDIVPQASGHFVYTVNNATSNGRGFVVLQNSDQLVEPGSQFLAFSAILLVLNLGDASSPRKRFGIEVIEDGIKVTLKDRQAREIRQAIYEGSNCSLSIGDTADSNDQFILRWTGDTCPSVVESPNPVRIVQDVRPNRGYYSTAVQTQSTVRTEAGQTNVIIDRVKTREIEAAIKKKLISSSDCNPQEIVNQLETSVRQACGTSLLTFANRLKIHAEKRLNITLSLGPGNFKKWSVGPNNQPINLARSLQLALSEVNVPAVNDNIVFVFNVILQKKN